MMRHNVARRDDYLEAMEKRQALERERMAQDIITGRVPPAPNSNLTPQGGTGLSPEAKERLIRQRVHATLQPIHEKELEKARIDTNRDLDKDLSDIERDEGRSQSTSVSATEAEKRIQQAKDTLQRMRENGREITRGAGRGRSR